jgi:sodium-dependent dicarboxylate transporter 2/3/5
MPSRAYSTIPKIRFSYVLDNNYLGPIRVLTYLKLLINILSESLKSLKFLIVGRIKMKNFLVKTKGVIHLTSNWGLINIKKTIGFTIPIIIFFAMYFGLPDVFPSSARMIIAIICFGVTLWALEPIPMGLTAMILLLLMLILNVAEPKIVFSGFSSQAIYLIVGGMMIAKAVNETALAERITFKIIKKWGGNAKGLLGSLIVIPQFQAFFIPATAVRTTLMLPIVTMIIDTLDAKPNSNLRKMLLLGVAFAGNISGTAVMTAAIGNILTVELLNHYAGIKITYFEWMLYTLPIWLILIPAMWILLLKMFPLPKEQQTFSTIEKEMETKIKELGPMDAKEIHCLLILTFIVGLWLTEPLHGMHPSTPALIGAAVMTFPKIGCASWEKVVKINYDTVILLSVTLSMGYVLIDSGAADIVGDYLSVGWILSFVQNPFAAVIFVVVLTQLVHKMISNVATAVVTLIPIMLSIASSADVDPLLLGFTAGLTSLYGFLLVVETMPNLLVHSTQLITQKEFFKPGVYATLITMATTIIVAMTWWKWIGLL